MPKMGRVNPVNGTPDNILRLHTRIATKMRSEEIMRMKQLERAIGQYVTSVDDGKEIESQRIRTRSLISDHNKLVS